MFVEDGFEMVFEELFEFGSALDLLAFGAFAQGGDDLGGGGDADVGGDEDHLEFFEGGFVDFASKGDDAVDFFAEVVAGLRDRLLHAVEDGFFLGFVEASEEGLDHWGTGDLGGGWPLLLSLAIQGNDPG